MKTEIRGRIVVRRMTVSARLSKARVERYTGRTIRTLLDPRATGTSGLTLGIITYQPGCNVEPHSHDDQEALYVLKGRGKAKIGDESIRLEPGTAVYIPRGMTHSVSNSSAKPIDAVLIHAPVGSP
jgi:quercetin dioxygenase-like cupin family protein